MTRLLSAKQGLVVAAGEDKGRIVGFDEKSNTATIAFAPDKAAAHPAIDNRPLHILRASDGRSLIAPGIDAAVDAETDRVIADSYKIDLTLPQFAKLREQPETLHAASEAFEAQMENIGAQIVRDGEVLRVIDSETGEPVDDQRRSDAVAALLSEIDKKVVERATATAKIGHDSDKVAEFERDTSIGLTSKISINHDGTATIGAVYTTSLGLSVQFKPRTVPIDDKVLSAMFPVLEAWDKQGLLGAISQTQLRSAMRQTLDHLKTTPAQATATEAGATAHPVVQRFEAAIEGLPEDKQVLAMQQAVAGFRSARGQDQEVVSGDRQALLTEIRAHVAAYDRGEKFDIPTQPRQILKDAAKPAVPATIATEDAQTLKELGFDKLGAGASFLTNEAVANIIENSMTPAEFYAHAPQELVRNIGGATAQPESSKAVDITPLDSGEESLAKFDKHITHNGGSDRRDAIVRQATEALTGEKTEERGDVLNRTFTAAWDAAHIGQIRKAVAELRKELPEVPEVRADRGAHNDLLEIERRVSDMSEKDQLKAINGLNSEFRKVAGKLDDEALPTDYASARAELLDHLRSTDFNVQQAKAEKILPKFADSHQLPTGLVEGQGYVVKSDQTGDGVAIQLDRPLDKAKAIAVWSEFADNNSENRALTSIARSKGGVLAAQGEHQPVQFKLKASEIFDRRGLMAGTDVKKCQAVAADMQAAGIKTRSERVRFLAERGFKASVGWAAENTGKSKRAGDAFQARELLVFNSAKQNVTKIETNGLPVKNIVPINNQAKAAFNANAYNNANQGWSKVAVVRQPTEKRTEKTKSLAKKNENSNNYDKMKSGGGKGLSLKSK